MRKEKGDFFIFFVERQKVALATQVSTHRLTDSPHHRITESPIIQLQTNPH